jgi:hypothetical protein
MTVRTQRSEWGIVKPSALAVLSYDQRELTAAHGTTGLCAIQNLRDVLSRTTMYIERTRP